MRSLSVFRTNPLKTAVLITVFNICFIQSASAASIKSWGNTVFDSSNFPITNATAIAAGYNHSLALKSNGSIVGFGRNYDDYKYCGQAGPSQIRHYKNAFIP